MASSSSASLFIKDSDVVMAPNNDIKPLVVDCQQFVRSKMNENVKYLHHKTFSKSAKDGRWPQRTTVACMNDCHTFDTVPIPIVQKFDQDPPDVPRVRCILLWKLCQDVYH